MEIWKRKSTCQSPIRLRQTLRLQFLRSSVKKMRQTGEWRHAQRASAPGRAQQPPLCAPSDGVGLPPLQEGQRDPGVARASFLVQLGNSVRGNPENLKLLQRATRTQREATTQSEHRLCRRSPFRNRLYPLLVCVPVHTGLCALLVQCGPGLPSCDLQAPRKRHNVVFI